MRHRFQYPRLRLTALLAGMTAITGCESASAPIAPIPQLDPATVVGTYDLIVYYASALPHGIDKTSNVAWNTVSERLTIDAAKPWSVTRIDRYAMPDIPIDSEKTVLSGTWKVSGQTMVLHADAGTLNLSVKGDTLTMTEECKSANFMECFYSPVLRWVKRPAGTP